MVQPSIPNTADTGSGVRSGLSTLDNQQIADNFKIPGSEAIGSNIANVANHPITPNQMASSPLAGITTLGTVANAGTMNAGLQQAGLAQAGLAQAGLQQAGLQQAGLHQAGLAQAGQTTINTAPSNQLLAGQVANINQLGQQAAGLGPSLAAQQAHQQGQENVANQMAMLASQRGASNSSLGLRAAMEAKAKADQSVMQAGVQGRTAEELAAQQQLTGALNGTQGQVMQGAQAQAGMNQNVNLANAAAANQQMGQNAQFGNAQQLANAQAANQQMQNNMVQSNQIGLANAGAANQQMGQNAAASNQISLANMQAGNQIGLANAQSANTAALQNAAGQNQAMLQQGQMSQQTEIANTQQQAQVALANLQAKQQTQGLNASEQNAMIQAQMALANNESTASQNYSNSMINQNLTQQGINAGLSINAANNTMGLVGAGIAGGAGLLGAGVTALGGTPSDENLKTNIKSADRSIKNFLSQMERPTSSFKLWGDR